MLGRQYRRAKIIVYPAVGLFSPGASCPDRGHGKSGNQVPHPPPGDDHSHAALAVEEIEDQYEAQTGILYAGFQGNRPGITAWQAIGFGKPITGQ